MLALLVGQDEDVSAERVRALLQEAWGLLSEWTWTHK